MKVSQRLSSSLTGTRITAEEVNSQHQRSSHKQELVWHGLKVKSKLTSGYIVWCPADLRGVETPQQVELSTKIQSSVERRHTTCSAKLLTAFCPHAQRLAFSSHRRAGHLEPAHFCVGAGHVPVHRRHQLGPHQLHFCCEEFWEVLREHAQHHATQDLGGEEKELHQIRIHHKPAGADQGV